MKILISNDDGYDSKGIAVLAEVASQFGEVTVVAPHRERSTSGHSLTLHKPLRLFQIKKNVYASTGTPADCVYLGARQVLKERPDVILSGINVGANLGTDTHYSGTVAATREGALMGVKSYAFSLVFTRQVDPHFVQEDLNYDVAGKYVKQVLEKTLHLNFPKYSYLNVNIPNLPEDKIEGIQLARQGIRFYSNLVEKRKDPRDKDYYWIGGDYEGFEPNELSDCHAVSQRKVSVTPMSIECTHQEFYRNLEQSIP
jgi:5'-nucleotidase